MALGKRREQHRCQRERWWCELWAQPEGLYRVKEMTEEQIEEALQLLNDRAHGLPSECFPDAKGPLEEHNDALIVAQVIVMGGHLILTSNMSFVETEPLEDWRRRHGNQYGTPAEVPLVQQADAMYTRWLDHPIGREVLRRTTLGAFWPEERRGERTRGGAGSHRRRRSAPAGRPHHGLRRTHARCARIRARARRARQCAARARTCRFVHARPNAAGWRCTRAKTPSTGQPCHEPATPIGPGSAGPDPSRRSMAAALALTASSVRPRTG